MEMNTTIFGGDDYDLGNNVQIDDLESERQTVFAFYIDKSSSMTPHEAVMPGCIDIVKEAIINSKSEDEFLVSLTLFNHEVSRSGYKNIRDIDNAYVASGGTALYDAIVGAKESLYNEEKTGYINVLRKGNITTKGIFAILSDGKDEHSVLKKCDAKRATEYMNSKEIITVFIAFGDKAKGIGEELGFQHVLESGETNEKTLRNIFEIVSKSAISASKNAANPDLFQV